MFCANRVAAGRSPWASSSRARWAGTGLSRPAGPGEACPASVQRGHGRDIDQEAGRDAGRRLERLIGPVAGRALSRVQQRFYHLGVAAVGGHVGLRQQQPGAGPDHAGGEDRQPAVDGDLQRVGLPLPQAGPDPAIPLSWPTLSSTSPWSPAANNGRAAAPWCLARKQKIPPERHLRVTPRLFAAP